MDVEFTENSGFIHAGRDCRRNPAGMVATAPDGIDANQCRPHPLRVIAAQLGKSRARADGTIAIGNVHNGQVLLADLRDTVGRVFSTFKRVVEDATNKRFAHSMARILLACASGLLCAPAFADYQSTCAGCHASTTPLRPLPCAQNEVNNLPNSSGSSGSIRAANNRAFLDYKIGNGMGGLTTSSLSAAQRDAIVAEIGSSCSVSQPVITSAAPPGGTVGVAYSYFVTATSAPVISGNSGRNPLVCATCSAGFTIASGALPTGLTVDGGSGEISGTPSVRGTFTGTIRASNLVGTAPTQAFSIFINGLTQAALTANINGSAAPPASNAGLSGNLTTSGGSGVGAVSFASLTGTICTVASTTVSYIAVGTCTVRATKAADSTYNSTFDDVSITVNQGSQAITFAALPNKLTTDPPFVVSATGGGSGNPVTFTASGVCAAGGVNGSTITLTGSTGSCTVSANQGGNFNFTAAPTVMQSFMVSDPAAEVFPPNCQAPAGWTVPAGAINGWSVATDSAAVGGCSLKSGLLPDAGSVVATSAYQFTGNFQAGSITMTRRVSSEISYDCFRVLIDGNQQSLGANNCGGLGGYFVPAISAIGDSGEIAFGSISIPIAAGNHTVTLSYDKDWGCCRGTSDAVWVDQLSMPLLT
ncbi:MAG TPA: Ig domain-containing protein, partial [Usitatibacteraceae bacterium]|nr:Ig domain-containing protein [Usitatibacteraceae bacterium]